MKIVRFQEGRTFYQSTPEGITNGWFFLVRGGNAVGPFESGDDLQTALRSFLKACLSSGDGGGRCLNCESVR
jgi:hypothetical protein